MKRLITSILMIGIMILSLSACGAAAPAPVSASPEPVASVEGEPSDVSKNFSFTPVDDDSKASAIASTEKEIEGKIEDGTKVEYGDLDGDGTVEYSIDYLVEDGDIITGKTEVYFNNELIHTVNDELPIDSGMLVYADYDGDGANELLFVYYPHVNSMPLDEYVVLKEKNGLWYEMEVPEDANGSNRFPVHVKYGDEPCTLKITCDGFDKVIDYDAKAHYEAAVKDIVESGGNEEFKAEFERVLAGEGFVKGADYGMVMPWGIWQVEAVTVNDEPCIRALHGLAGAQLERYDVLGNLYIYFRFDAKGRVKIVDMEFYDDLSGGTPE